MKKAIFVSSIILLAIVNLYGGNPEVDYLKESCNDGSPRDCFKLANLYDMTGEYYKKKAYQKKGLNILKEGCREQDSRACGELGIVYMGKGIPGVLKTDYKKGKKLLLKSCKSNYAKACNSLGYKYETGKGTKKDLSQAIKYYKKACSLGSSLACKNYRIVKRKLK